MLTIEQLMQEALALSNSDRAQLVEKLVESLEFDIDPGIQDAWTIEAERRRGEITSGTIEPISGEEALAQVRELLNP